MTHTTMPLPIGDGEMTLHVWEPESGSGPGVVLIQEIFGVEDYLVSVAERLAAAGYVVAAPDLFWRFAPGFTTTTDEAGLGEAFAMAQQLDRDLAVSDCVASLDALAALDSVTGTPGVLGFCLGGTLAFAVAIAAEPSVCVAYYGSGVADQLDRIDAVSCPVLFHFGSADDFIPEAQVDAVAAAIVGRDEFVLNVEAAGHAFDNHTRAMFHDADAAAAAWAKTMTFLGQHVPA